MTKKDERTLVTKSLTIRNDIQKAMELTGEIKEGFADHKAVFSVRARKSMETRIDDLEKTLQSLDERTKTIEEQTRPQTGWQKVKDYIFGGIVGWIIAIIFGLILLLLGFNIL